MPFICRRACVDILRLLIDNDPGVEIELDSASLKFYDDLSSKVRPHLLDHLRTVPPGAGEKLSLQYQFALVAALIWGHRIDVKPLKLFSSQARILNKTTDRRGNLNRCFLSIQQESNLFFQGDQGSPSSSTSSSSSISGLFSMPHNNMVTNYRVVQQNVAPEIDLLLVTLH